jgi:malonate decarboxylase delta subunit
MDATDFNPPALETLRFEWPGTRPAGAFAPVLVGVVASGQLELLMEPLALPLCRVEIQTSARGFEPIWEAVLSDFQARHGLAGILISIHDMGATPAVVGLRLAQAVAEIA